MSADLRRIRARGVLLMSDRAQAWERRDWPAKDYNEAMNSRCWAKLEKRRARILRQYPVRASAAELASGLEGARDG